MIEPQLKFIEIYKFGRSQWAIGINFAIDKLTDDFREIYIGINLFKWQVSIGKMMK